MQKDTEKPLEGGSGLVRTYTAAARQQQAQPPTSQRQKKQQQKRPQARLLTRRDVWGDRGSRDGGERAAHARWLDA